MGSVRADSYGPGMGISSSQRRTIGLSIAITQTTVMSNTLMSTVLPDVLDEFGQPDHAAGYLVMATALPGFFFAPFLGMAADRFGRREVLVPCLAVYGLTGLGTAVAPSMAWMIAARLAMGVSVAAMISLAIVLISDQFDGERRTFWIGINAGILTLSMAVSPVIAGLIAEAAGWRWAMVPYSSAFFVAVATWFLLSPGTRCTQQTWTEQGRQTLRVAAQPTIRTCILTGTVVFAVMFGVFLTTMPVHLDDRFDLSAGARGLILGIPAIPASIAAFGAARMRRRFGIGNALLVLATSWTVPFVIFGTADTVGLIVIGAMLYGFCEGALLPLLQDTAIAQADPSTRGAVMAVWNSFVRLGQTLGPAITLVTIGAWGTDRTMLLGVAGVAIIVALVTRPAIRRSVRR